MGAVEEHADAEVARKGLTGGRAAAYKGAIFAHARREHLQKVRAGLAATAAAGGPTAPIRRRGERRGLIPRTDGARQRAHARQYKQFAIDFDRADRQRAKAEAKATAAAERAKAAEARRQAAAAKKAELEQQRAYRKGERVFEATMREIAREDARAATERHRAALEALHGAYEEQRYEHRMYQATNDELYRVIKQRGGIRPMARSTITGKRAEAGEYETIPKALKSSRGLAADQLTEELRESYPHLGITDTAELYEALDQRGRKGAGIRKPLPSFSEWARQHGVKIVNKPDEDADLRALALFTSQRSLDIPGDQMQWGDIE